MQSLCPAWEAEVARRLQSCSRWKEDAHVSQKFSQVIGVTKETGERQKPVTRLDCCSIARLVLPWSLKATTG